MAWTDLHTLRMRIQAFAEMACREEGLDGAVVDVVVSDPRPGKARVVEVRVGRANPPRPIPVDDRRDVDGTDPMWEPVRGRKWEEN